MKPIRIVIAEDEYFTREGICRLIEAGPGFEIVGQADNGEDAINLVDEHQPDVVLLDISMPPGIDGIEVMRRLRAKGCTIPLIALTHEKRVIKLVEKVGGNGFIPKDKYQMFIPTLQCVAQTGSKIFINPETTEAFSKVQKRVDAAKLSELELDVWQLIAYKNEEIARRLFKTEGRIRNLVTELYFKLDIPKSEKVGQRVQAIEMARAYGILETPKDEDWEYD